MGKSKKTPSASCVLCGSIKYELLYPSTFKTTVHLTTSIFSARRLPDKVHGTVVKCVRCGLVRTLERVSPKTLSELYVQSRFTYNNLTGNLKTTYLQVIKDAIVQLRHKNSFLEIGCGNGFLLNEVKKLGFPQVFGVEPSLDAFQKASLRVKRLIKNSIFKSKLFPKRSFDLIAAFQVFDHIQNPNQFLRICRNYLKDDGLLLLFNHDVKAVSAIIFGEKSPIFDIEHPYLYSQKTISKILLKNSLKAIKIGSPTTVISLAYFIRLLPLPLALKKIIENSKSHLTEINLRLRLGNLCAIARKIT